jgi:hypothetical protein
MTDFNRGGPVQTALHREAPLLDVLRWRLGIKRGETDRGLAEHRRTKIEMGGDNARGWNEIVTLLSLGENVRNIVALIAPRVHIHGREKNSKRGMDPNW